MVLKYISPTVIKFPIKGQLISFLFIPMESFQYFVPDLFGELLCLHVVADFRTFENR